MNTEATNMTIDMAPHDTPTHTASQSRPPVEGQTVESQTERTANPPASTPQESSPGNLKGIEVIKAGILANRGAEYPEVYSPKNLLNPAGLMDGEKAARRIAAALIRRQRIVLVADFDCDGATGGAVMMRGLTMLADALAGPSKKARADQSDMEPPAKSDRAELHYVIPDRFDYGYGLKPELATQVIRPMNPDLIITIDNGISSHAAVDLIATWPTTPESSTPDVIITDHHEPGDTLPSAYAVVNPARKDCQFESKALCGAGVAFNVILLVRRAIVELIGGNPRGAVMASRMRTVALNHLSDLVALGTIGDMVPMDANNRLLVKVGLDRMNKGYQMTPHASHTKGLLCYGLRALLERASVTHPITTTDLAFQVVPRINSVGRLTKPLAGIECLLADTQDEANEKARRCDELNQERKAVQATMEDQAKASLSDIVDAYQSSVSDAQPLPDRQAPNSIILQDDTWHTGLVGLIASRIKEKSGGVVFCFAPEKGSAGEVDTQWADAELPETIDPGDADINWLKGSGRSDTIHLRDALVYVSAKAPDLLMQFGGHARAAGMTLYRPHLPRFRRLFSEAVDHLLATAPLENRQFDDGALPAVHRSFPFAHWIERQPWGQLFPEPQFTQTFRVAGARTLSEKHQRLVVVDANANPADGQTASAEPFQMMWFFSVDDQTPAVEEGSLITLTYRLAVNRFNGRNTLQGTVIKQAD